MNPRSRNAGFTISKKDLHNIYSGRKRAQKPYEVFAKLYPETVEEAKERRCDEEGIEGRQKLAVWHEVAKQLYDSATEDQLEAVRIEMNHELGAESGDSPGSYLRFVFA